MSLHDASGHLAVAVAVVGAGLSWFLVSAFFFASSGLNTFSRKLLAMNYVRTEFCLVFARVYAETPASVWIVGSAW